MQFIYTGKTDASMSQAIPLLKYAVDFEVDGLVLHCQDLLKGELSDDAVLQVYKAAWEFKRMDLVGACLTYICKYFKNTL